MNPSLRGLLHGGGVVVRSPARGSNSDGDDSGASASDDVREATYTLSETITVFSRAVGAAGQGACRSSEGVAAASPDLISQRLASASTAVSGVALGQSGGHHRSEETRARILVAAREVFATRGYEGVSVSDIVSAAGSTKGAFYPFFPLKKALFLKVVTCGEESLGEVVQEMASLEQRGEQL